MPTYQYACKACGEGLEAVQGFHDAPLTECPACGGPLRKVFSSVGVVFKGSGFYRTDSRAAAATGDKASGSAADAGSSSSSKADAKPAAVPSGGSGKGESTSSAAKPTTGSTAA